MSDDDPWIDQTLRGQPEAFGHLALKYQDRLFQAVFHMVGHAEDARDLVQESLVQAMLHLDSFERHCAFYTWLYRIAFNAAMSHRRRRRPTASVEQASERAGVEPSDRGDGPLETLEREEQCRQVQEAIARLDADHRAVLVLREIDGRNYESIAAILDIPLGTVRSRLHRARLELRERLQAMLVGETQQSDGL
ncbi:MAG: sigma-70 family RNA polymerase sigma factor [Thermoguttaceae bacterium]